MLDITCNLNNPAATCASTQDAISVDEYVLDACFTTDPLSSLDGVSTTTEVLVVTAYNVLFLLSFSSLADQGTRTTAPRLLSYGPSCALYSAHILRSDSRTALVAAGTVFGGVHVWQCSLQQGGEFPADTVKGTLIHDYSGHEGSVFGVRFIRLLNHPPHDLVVVSCSDDRSIKLWSVPFSDDSKDSLLDVQSKFIHGSATGFTKSHDGLKHSLLGSAVGHQARIWSVKHCANERKGDLLISFSEDASAQTWRIADSSYRSRSESDSLALQHVQTTACHFGKNIWAGEVFAGDEPFILTAGADSRISKVSMNHVDLPFVWSSLSRVHAPPNRENLVSGQTFPILKTMMRQFSADHDGLQRSKHPPFHDMFKSYCWLASDILLTTTEMGRMQLGNLRQRRDIDCSPGALSASRDLNALEIEWNIIGQDSDLASFALVSGIPGRFALLAGSTGRVLIYLIEQDALKPFTKLPRKIAFVHTVVVLHDTDTAQIAEDCFGAVLTCVGMRTAYFIVMNGKLTSDAFETGKVLRTVSLGAEFVVTSALFFSSGLLILGGRSGALALYEISNSESLSVIEPTLVQSQVHGQESITSIHKLHGSKDSLIMTTGRDGHLAVHRVFSGYRDTAGIETIHRIRLPFGPNVEGAIFHPMTYELLVWGFRSQSFIVWNYSEQLETMTVQCGGAGRCWSYSPHQSDPGGGSFVWTQASECHVRFQSKASHTILQKGLHGREIRTVAVRPDIEDGLGHLIATGAEDTTIRISKYRESSKVHGYLFDCFAILDHHTTGIQKILWSPDGRHMFSAAGKEEFHVWRVRPVPYIKVGIVNVATCPPVTISGDLRIMDFDILKVASSSRGSAEAYLVAIGYSDSSVRLWQFDPWSSAQRIRCMTVHYYSTICITQCRFIVFNGGQYVITCATDGFVAIWHLIAGGYGATFLTSTPIASSALPSKGSLTAMDLHLQLDRVTSVAVHQSSIKSMVLAPISSTTSLVITGGDDNGLGFTLITVPAGHKSEPHFVRLLVPEAHASAINALALIEAPEVSRRISTGTSHTGEEAYWRSLIITASNDQQLKTWTVDIRCPGRATESAKVALETQSLTDGEIILTRHAHAWSSVADVGSLDTFPTNDGSDHLRKVVVAGVGLETWSVW